MSNKAENEKKKADEVSSYRKWKIDHWDKRIKYYNRKEMQEVGRINGFDGTFAITELSKIPEELLGFLNLHFNAGKRRKAKYSLDDVNTALNEVWEGPGSMEKIFRLEMEYDYDLVFEEKEV